MKYRDPKTGEFKEVYTKAADTLPVGAVVGYDGTEVPAGWEKVEGSNNQIRKKESSVGILGKIVNSKTNSTTDAYSADFINGIIEELSSLKTAFEAYQGIVNNTSKLIFTGQWIIGNSAYGGGTELRLPIFNPFNKFPDITGVTIDYYDKTDGGWKPCTNLNVRTYKTTFVILQMTSYTPGDAENVLLRVNGVIQV